MSSIFGEPDSRPDVLYREFVRNAPPSRRLADRLAIGRIRIGRDRRAALLGGSVAAIVALVLAGPMPGGQGTARVATAPVSAPLAPLPTAATVAAAAPSSPTAAAPFVPPAPKRVAANHPKVVEPKAAPIQLSRVTLPPDRPMLPPVLVTVSTRNIETLPGGKTWVGAFPAPLPRPGSAVTKVAKVGTPVLGERPMRRPVTASAAQESVPDDGRPAPRPVQVASLGPVTADLARSVIAADDTPRPEPRPEPAIAAAPVAKPVVKAAAVAAPVARVAPSVPAPAPKPVRVASLAPTTVAPATISAVTPKSAAPVITAAPVAKTGPVVKAAPVVQATPAVATVGRVTTQAPVRVVPVRATAAPAAARPAQVAALTASQNAVRQPAPVQAPAVQPTRTVSRKAMEREGLSRGNISLIGVFGTGDARRALLLMPNGDIERVRVGDSVRGAQIASVDDETVLLRSGGRDTLLRLPD